MSDLSDLYQEVILDHNKRPRNFRAIASPSHHAEGYNPLCGDRLNLYVQVDGNVITDVAFQGSGCAISKASASLLTEALVGKTRWEVQTIFKAVRDMITTGRMDSDLGKIVALAGVHKFPERIKCAVLPWHAVLAAVGGAGTVSTEAKD